jgi:hypothetical protein
MAKLEQRKGLYGGFKPGSTGGPGTGKFINTVKRISNNVKRKAGDIVSNVKDKIETRKNEKATEELAAEGSSKNPRFLQDALNPAQNAAMTAGGSRPMTAMNNPQVDPMTGMPITQGGQANMNPNFIGGMANSNLPTTAMLAQEKYNAELADVNGNGVTEDWEENRAKKFTVAQEKKMMRTMKPLVKLNPSETYSSYKDFRGDMQKATIDDSTFTSDSTKFKAGINPKYKLDMNKSYNYNLENNPKAVEFSERMTPEINQSRRSTKYMRVKKR